MRYFNRVSRTFLWTVVALLAWALSGNAEDQKGPELKGVTYFGGAGDQGWNPNGGPGLFLSDGRLFVCGADMGSPLGTQSVCAAYQVSPAAAPLFSFRWPDQKQTAGLNEEGFADITLTREGIYCAGWDSVVSTDTIGSKEHKAVLVKFPLNGPTGPDVGGSLWVAKEIFVPAYSGIEGFLGVTAVEENGTPFLYATGHVQSNWANNTAFLAKYNTQGKRLWFKLLSDPGWERNGYGWAVAGMNGYLYVSGCVHYPYTIADNLRAALWKVDPNGNIVWMKTCDTVIPNTLWRRWRLAASQGHLYLVTAQKYGPKGGADALILKYDEAGNLLWSKSWGTSKDDLAHGVTVLGNRLYVVGETAGWAGGGRDSFLLEMDCETGEILSVNYHGGAYDDIAYDVKAVGKDLIVVGTSRSSAEAGNNPGQLDFMILRYSLTAPLPALTVPIDIKPGGIPNPIHLKAQGTIPVAILSTPEWDPVAQVDRASVTFGRTGFEKSLSSNQKIGSEDVNKDGLLDLVCHFDNTLTAFQAADTKGFLRGTTLSGRSFVGIDSIVVVPAQEKELKKEKEHRELKEPKGPAPILRKPRQEIIKPVVPTSRSRQPSSAPSRDEMKRLQREGGVAY